jgi:hypothetical protein
VDKRGMNGWKAAKEQEQKALTKKKQERRAKKADGQLRSVLVAVYCKGTREHIPASRNSLTDYNL